MPSVSFVLYIVTNRHLRSQNKPLGKNQKRSWKLQRNELSLSLSSESMQKCRNYPKVTSVLIYKASRHKILEYLFTLQKGVV